MAEKYRIKLNKRNGTIVVRRVHKSIKLKHSGLRGPRGFFGRVEIGTTSTLAPGSQATVENTGTDTEAILNFGIPEGEKGDKGDTGVSTFVRVHHGTNANVVRPDSFFVEWVGSVPPTNGTVEDTWINTA